MTAQDLVRPIQSLPSVGFNASNLPSDQTERLQLILSAGLRRRCSTNVVVYGGHIRAADEFAAVALECMQAGDSLWRVGAGPATGSKATWIPQDHRLLSMLNAGVVFLPADDQHKNVFEEWQDRATVIFVGPGLFQDTFVAFAEHMLGWDVPLPPPKDSGRTYLPPIPAGVQALAAHARSEPLNVGNTFTTFRSDFWSEDRKIHSAVEGTEGGELSVTFVARDPQLLGTRIRFRFRTSAGRILQGEKQLLRDEGDASRLVAFWTGNQMDLSERSTTEPGKPGETAELIFDFEVLPQEPSA